MSKFDGLKQRLRDPYAYFSPAIVKDGMDAVDAIEELESLLLRIGQPGKEIVFCRDGHEEAVLLIRAALGETK